MRIIGRLTDVREKLLRNGRIQRWLTAQIEADSRDLSVMPSPQNRRWMLLLLIPLAVLLGAELVARALLPVLLRSHPLLLISLDANTHDLLLAGVKVATVDFIVAAVAWRMVAHVIYYLIGRQYGDVVLLWINRKSALAASLLRRVQAVFLRISSLAVFVLAGDIVSLLAGSIGMSIRRFLILQLLGNALHVTLVLLVIHLARAPLTRVVTFIDGDTTTLTVAFTIAAMIGIAVNARMHKSAIGDLARAIRKPNSEPGKQDLDDSCCNGEDGDI